MAKCCVAIISLFLSTTIWAQAADTVKIHNGVPAGNIAPTAMWEESVILSPQGPCKVMAVRIHYQGTGTDTVRITGDAAEGTIPPTQYCYSYNTLGKVVVNVTQPGWVTVDFSQHNIRLGGFDRVVVQHIQPRPAPAWSVDAAQSNPATSFVYDPVTPNPNFFNIPGIFRLASGDFMVELIVEYENESQPAPTLTNVTTEVGLTNEDGSLMRSALASVADINGDGFDDVIVGSVAFIYDTATGFKRTPLGIQASNTVWADIDNDGDLDCFAVFANGTPGRKDGLYINDGTGTLTPAPGSGINNEAPTVTPLFFDFDHDGDLDLFVANGRRTEGGNEIYYQDKLFRNDGNWMFTDVTASSGIAAAEPAPYFDCWAASLVDVNMDGWTDIFVATYRLAPDRLYINNHDGTFTESSVATGAVGVPTALANYFGHGMGSDWADFDNDGDIDFAVGNLGHPDQRGQFSNPSLIMRNVGSATTPTFENWYSESNGILDWHGVTFREMNSCMCFADFDQDGFQDLFHPQISYDAFGAGATRPAHFYLQEDGKFVDRTWESGLFVHGAWTGIRFDYDRDGDLDILAASSQHEVRLFRNDMPKKGNSVVIQLVDNSFTDVVDRAYGSTVRVYAGGKVFLRQLPGTIIGARCSQMSHDLHVGIGDIRFVDSATVTWPNGVLTRHPNLALNTVNVLFSNGTMISNKAIAAPQLHIPAQHAIGVATSPTLSVRTVSNNAVVQLSPTANFSENVIEQRGVGFSTPLQQPLLDGKTYYWRARFEDNQMVGPWSSTWQFTVGSPQPQQVVVLSPLPNSTSVNLTPTIRWTQARFGSWQSLPLEYNVQVLSESGEVVCEFTTADTSWTACELLPLTKHRVRVRALTTDANGDWSNAIEFTTYGTPENVALTTPANLAMNVPIRPRFEWEEHPWVDAGYDIEYSLNSDFSDATQRERNSTSYNLTRALETGRVYHWRVRGKNQAGVGQWSSPFSFTVEGVVSVEDNEILTPNNAAAFKMYDLLGRLVAEGDMPSEQAVSFPGTVFMVYFDRNGEVLTSRMLFR